MESSTTCLANGIYVPTAMLEQAALNFPDSDREMAQFRSYARELSRDIDGDAINDQYGYGACGWNPWQIGPWIHSFGGEMLDETWSESRMNMPETIEALEFIQGRFEEESIPPISIQWDYLPEHNKCAMWLAGVGRWRFTETSIGPTTMFNTFLHTGNELLCWAGPGTVSRRIQRIRKQPGKH